MKTIENPPKFITREIAADFEEFSLPLHVKRDLSIVVPAVKGTRLLKYGIHSYSFYNFKTLRGCRVTIRHKNIIRFQLNKLKTAEFNEGKPALPVLFRHFHYNFSFIEEIMLMTVPHTVTPMGNGRYLINLWAYFGFLDIDCVNKTVAYRLIDDKSYARVLGSQQYYDASKNELYFTVYSLKQSIERIDNTDRRVNCVLFRQNVATGEAQAVWSGAFADYTHDIVINKHGTYCAIPELGLYTDASKAIVPSKALILDLAAGKNWTIERFSVAAHAQFDPDDPTVIYFSNHNFTFEHTNLFKLLKQATYKVDFKGPASIYKYRITPDGPIETGAFTRNDFFRLTNFHVFRHGDRKIIAATGFPDEILLIDAKRMELIRKIKIVNTCDLETGHPKTKASIGTFSPSFDGEKLYVQTTRSFQVVDTATGEPDMVISHFFNHTCSNHMKTSSDTTW